MFTGEINTFSAYFRICFQKLTICITYFKFMYLATERRETTSWVDFITATLSEAKSCSSPLYAMNRVAAFALCHKQGQTSSHGEWGIDTLSSLPSALSVVLPPLHSPAYFFPLASDPFDVLISEPGSIDSILCLSYIFTFNFYTKKLVEPNLQSVF